MPRETGRTVAVVATPSALELVKHGLARGGLRGEEIEVAEFVVEASSHRGDRGPLRMHGRHVAMGACAGATVWMAWASFLPETTSGLLLTAGFGAALLGGIAGLVLSVLIEVDPTVAVRRKFWKLRVTEASPNAGKAKAIASRTGRTLHRLITAAFEVPQKK